MELRVYKFPIMNDKFRHLVEIEYCKLLNKYRNGDTLDEESIDWMDSANNWLMSI